MQSVLSSHTSSKARSSACGGSPGGAPPLANCGSPAAVANSCRKAGVLCSSSRAKTGTTSAPFQQARLRCTVAWPEWRRGHLGDEAGAHLVLDLPDMPEHGCLKDAMRIQTADDRHQTGFENQHLMGKRAVWTHEQ